jgi:hypothetical protein
MAGEEALLVARDSSVHGSGLSTPRSSSQRLHRLERAAGSFALEEALFLAQSRAREAEEAMSCYDQRWATRRQLLHIFYSILQVLTPCISSCSHSFYRPQIGAEIILVALAVKPCVFSNLCHTRRMGSVTMSIGRMEEAVLKALNMLDEARQRERQCLTRFVFPRN